MKKSEQLFKDLHQIKPSYIEEAQTQVQEKKSKKPSLRIALVASFLFLFIALPNTSPALARTLHDIPLLGQVFEVVTLHKVEETNQLTTIKSETPKIVNETNHTAVEEVNTSAKDYTDQLLDVFNSEHDGDPSHLSITHKIITNNDTWFSLAIYSLEIGASGAEKNKYYNIDKVTGEHVTFGTFFSDFASAKKAINTYIIETMEAKMANDEDITYFIAPKDDTGFSTVTEKQNFYLNDEGVLIVSFDEYDVAPGYMGIVEFEIPASIYSDFK